MGSKTIAVPVCIFIFLRERQSLELISKIRQVKPPRMYIVGEGYRPNRPGEKEKVQAVRNAVETAIDWPCEVKTNYVPEDIGAGRRIATGVSWVFENEQKCIFLEDDIDPDTSFFYYCEELLNRYQEDKRIGMISGYNNLGEFDCHGDSYCYSTCGSIYGWASWQDRWKCFDWDMKALENPDTVEAIVRRMAGDGNKGAKQRVNGWKKAKAKIQAGSLSTWDYQWNLSRLSNGYLDIVPSKSLTQNRGIDAAATNSTSQMKLLPKRIQKVMNIRKNAISFPLKHPQYVLRNWKYDDEYLSTNTMSACRRIKESIEVRCRRLFYKSRLDH